MHRSIPLVAASAMTVLLVGGCAQSANAPGAGDERTSLVAAYSEGGQTLNPYEANDVTSDTFVLAAYDQLVTYAVDVVDGEATARTQEIEPMLAESWEVNDDATEYTFTLRDDVEFQSGNPLTSADVVGSLELIEASASASFLYGMAGIASYEALDEHTVRISLTGPNHLFLQILPMYSFSIVDTALVEESGGAEWLSTSTAGSGPYVIEAWDPATEATLTRNEDYWGEAPAVDDVTVRFIAEPANRVQLLSGGDVDLATEIPANDVEGLAETDGVVIDSRASNKILFFAMNNEIAPFDDPLVRQAISYAIPYEQLVDDVMEGQASPLTSAVPSSMAGFDDSTYAYEHDLDRARELLAEAGYPDGFTFDFTLGGGFQDWADDAVLIQAELAQIGVTMNIQNMARPQFLEALDTRQVQAYISRWTSFVNDPQYHLGLLMTTDTSSNYMNYSNPEVDALWQQASQETDESVREELYGQMQALITADAPWAYLYEYNIVVGLSEGTEGYTSYPDGIVRFAQLSVEA
ncbi:ABC transporter substrate-binding protein [Agrococcus sp. SGAir0287]|uniref:ABC transporter substrate-binding protein n=1 Tax=Agrococcus sp. SGAir0287 TaxID=2070347 RepID=UPI0010CD1E2F|nr:ABC transporter substrate-binding protein [Agrococcus sp. SGAir0287]QCR20243.1 peptide ABC transporter substrate-binding protein [Agrococcus sp. SGAir0287]